MSLKCWLGGPQMQFCRLGMRWDAHLENWIGLRLCLDGAEMQLCGPGWRLKVTKMEVKCKHGDPDWDTTWMERKDANLETRLGWDGTWIELRHISWDLNMGNGSRNMRFNYHDPDWRDTWLGLWWDANIGTWLDVTWVKVRYEYLYLYEI